MSTYVMNDKHNDKHNDKPNYKPNDKPNDNMDQERNGITEHSAKKETLSPIMMSVRL